MRLNTEHLENRNDTTHDYGKAFAEETIKLLPDFLKDVRILQTTLKEKFGSKNA